MPITIGSNIGALRAQQQLSNNTSALGRIYERLSSGQRINRASDDAAGLAIADSLRTDARLYSMASRNINDGVSLLNIIDGTLSQQKELITRLKELAEQSANGVYSDEQRSSLNGEYVSLLWEFGRLADATDFNGLKPLLGGREEHLDQLLLQVGIDGTLDSTLGIELSDTGTLSGNFDLSDAAANGASIQSHTFEELQAAFSNRFIRVSIVDDSGTERDLLIGIQNQVHLPPYQSVAVSIFQRVSDTGGVGAQTGLGVLGQVTDANDEWVYAAQQTIGNFHTSTGVFNGEIADVNRSLVFDDGAVSGNIGLDLSNLNFYLPGSSLEETAIQFTGIENEQAALDALDMLTEKASELSIQQGLVGAMQSRLLSSLNVAEVSREQVSSAESRIRDADIASETAALTRLQILQQASVAILSQASQQPQLAIQLLQTSA